MPYSNKLEVIPAVVPSGTFSIAEIAMPEQSQNNRDSDRGMKNSGPRSYPQHSTSQATKSQDPGVLLLP